MKQNFCISRKQFVGGLAAAFGGLILPADAFGAGTPIMKFGLVSDVHLGGEGKAADLEKVLRFFDAQGVDAVMIPGDIAHTGLINNEVFTPGHGWMPKGAELKPEDLPIDYEIDWIRLYQRKGEEIRLWSALPER